MPSLRKTLLLLIYVLCAFRSARSGDSGDARPCSGPHCPGGRTHKPSRQHNPTTQSRSINQHHPPSSFPLENHATHLSQRGRSGDQTRESVQTRVPGGFGPACADCVRPDHVMNDTSECKGIECRLPLRIRRPCAGEGCVPGTSQPPLVHVADRAAQFLGEFPDIGYPASESGAPLGVQLTCDIKPGENEVPAEDALILHLQLAKGQEKLVEALRAQQVVIRDLQKRLVDQQETLLSQQREILDQQRRMFEQMDVVKVQYGLLSDTIKQVSFQGLQGELQSYFESHLTSLQNQARSHLQKSYAVHKVDVDAKVVNVVGDAGHPLLGCQTVCGPEEFCEFQKDQPQCEKCTVCPPGFFLVSQCSPTADRMCQDRDECLELPSLCGERVKCLNTPGGFRCLGVSEREISTGLCGLEYFYNQELQECQACSDCDGEPVAVPCTSTSDAVCGSVSENMLSQSWAASIVIPPTKLRSTSIYPGVQLKIRGKEENNLLINHDDYLNLQQHGLVWIDYNFALKHSCRNFLQVGIQINGSEEEGHDLSGVRIEQPERKFFQGVTVSAAAEVEPNYNLTLVLKSPNQYCNQSKDIQVYELGGASFSLLWLSHDTGAVAMTAQMSTAAHYQSNYRPTFRISTVSDPYIVSLTHDSRGVRFMESGVVKFVLQQAVYSMGHTCVREGFSLIAYVNRNGTNQEVLRSFKSGVNYRDTSITLSGATRVDSEDWLNFEIVAPSQCNVRYFGDSSGISMLSLIWIPATVSSTFMATVSRTGLPTGAVRNKPLFFRQMSPNTDQMRLAASDEPYAHRNFLFTQAGTVSVVLNLKLIHSCNVIKLTLYQQSMDGGQSISLSQQVGGHMPEGSEWASVGLRTSFDVQNGTAIYVSLDCVRGRINQITHEGGTNISILWMAS
ncbi:uncharacterized protein nell3 [Danio aesculapii]|uniref:uncharacterized protein nell3 n=1 Tax=Danio aesculapii TaxID=1142201 RepID=UPI0024BFF85A|nr:uncharacterized protein nell3 [Danio aesculapii]XP_056306132.1 uncharacterized protein nell3 [Danio aesculapii]